MQRADVNERRARHVVADAVSGANGENGPFALLRRDHPLFPLELVALNGNDASALFVVSSFVLNIFAALLQVYRLVRPAASSEDAAQFTVWRSGESCYASLRVHMAEFPRLVEVFGSKLDPCVWRRYLSELGPEECKEPRQLELCLFDGWCANLAGGQSSCVRGRLHLLPAACQVNKRTGKPYDKHGVFDFRHQVEKGPRDLCRDGLRCSQTVEEYTWEHETGRGGWVKEIEGERDGADAHRLLLPYHHSPDEFKTSGCTTTIDAVSSDVDWVIFVERLQELEGSGHLLVSESRSKPLVMWINLGQFETRLPGGHAHVHVATRDKWEAKKNQQLACDRWLWVNCHNNMFDVPYVGRFVDHDRGTFYKDDDGGVRLKAAVQKNQSLTGKKLKQKNTKKGR
jgi:hypothetical protein